jgi:hypothetical protein
MKMEKNVVNNLKGAVALRVLIGMPEDGLVDVRLLHFLFHLIENTEHTHTPDCISMNIA